MNEKFLIGVVLPNETYGIPKKHWINMERFAGRPTTMSRVIFDEGKAIGFDWEVGGKWMMYSMDQESPNALIGVRLGEFPKKSWDYDFERVEGRPYYKLVQDV